MAPIERPDWGSGGALAPAGGNELDIADHDGGMLADLDAGFPNPAVESRYRAMVAGRMERWRLSAEQAREALPSRLVSEWERSGGVEIRLAEAQKAAIGVLEGLNASDRAEFVHSFDALPDGARSAILLELSLGSAGSVRSASEEDIARFAATPEGGALIKEWGGRASRNIGVVYSRMDRMLRPLTADETVAALDWFESLPPQGAAAIFRLLVRR